MTQRPSILPFRPPLTLPSLEPNVPPSFPEHRLAGVTRYAIQSPHPPCRYIHTRKKEKGENKNVVGYFDFQSTIGIRTNTRPRSDAVITINIYTTRRVLKLISSAPQPVRSLARSPQFRQILGPTATRISYTLAARPGLFTASWCVAAVVRLRSHTPYPHSRVGPSQPKHQTA